MFGFIRPGPRRQRGRRSKRVLGCTDTRAGATGAAGAVDPGRGRITAETARKDRLARLMEGEPVLSAAVQAWDLELVD